MLQGKTVVLGVTGGIAAYKAAELISRLKKKGAEVIVLMTKAATEFITPLTMETLSGNRAVSDMFRRDFTFEVEHISIAKRADVFAVVPATANVIGKLAAGIADDMLTTTALATRAPVLIAPAMNTAMYENPAVQQNIRTLKARGVSFVEPASGRLACGDTGKGKLADVAEIEAKIEEMLTPKDLAGLRILVTAGPTREALDPVRFLTNHSTGKMGYALADRAAARGAEVTLVTGPSALKTPLEVRRVDVVSAEDMMREVCGRQTEQDIIIKAAAVGDYRPKTRSEEKIKKQDGILTLELERNPDILSMLGQNKPNHQVLCGFSMETKDMIENSEKKLRRKNCDVMVANNLKTAGAGFGTDTNVVTLLYRDGRREALERMEKISVADIILDRLADLHRNKS